MSYAELGEKGEEVQTTATTPHPEEKKDEYRPNRRERRSKGILINKAVMRRWHAESIKQRLFAPKEETKVANGPVPPSTGGETEPPPSP